MAGVESGATQIPGQAGDPVLSTSKANPLRKVDQRSTRPNDISVRNVTSDPASSPPRPAGAALSSIDAPRSSSPMSNAASPSRAFHNASPRHLSPATSQIFERDVQESTTLAPELSPAIPSHIATEDHIPPVLEASSLAIAENKNPDEVEIVMSSAHQPAASTIVGSQGSGNSGLLDSTILSQSSQADLTASLSQDGEEHGSTLGSVDLQDPRRLSFISFADVVNAEHSEMGASTAGSVAGNRSPSPVRSPFAGARIPASPPTSSSSFKDLETSPVRGGGAASVTSVPASTHGGEVTIETLRKTIEKTADPASTMPLGAPLSATAADDGVTRSFR